MRTQENLLVLLVIVRALMGLSNLSYAQSQSFSETIPFSEWVPCANNGEGEMVSGSITLHAVLHLDKKDFFTKLHFQPQSTDLVGETTGKRYTVNGADNFMRNSYYTLGAVVYTSISRFHIVGDGIQFMKKETYHFTVNDNGELSSSVESEGVTCK